MTHRTPVAFLVLVGWTLACAGPQSGPSSVLPPLQPREKPVEAPPPPPRPPPMPVEALLEEVAGLPASWVPVARAPDGWFVCQDRVKVGIDTTQPRPTLSFGDDQRAIARAESHGLDVVFATDPEGTASFRWEDRAMKVARWTLPDGQAQSYVIAELSGGLPVHETCD